MGPSRKWYESALPSDAFILRQAAWRECVYNKEDWNTQTANLKVVRRSVGGTHMTAVSWRKVSAENVSLEKHQSVSDLFNCTDEITTLKLAAHKKAVTAELKTWARTCSKRPSLGKTLSLARAVAPSVLVTAHID